MDTLNAIAGLALLIAPPIVIAVAIRALGGRDGTSSDLPSLLMPIVAPRAFLDTPRRAVPEPDAPAWRLDRVPAPGARSGTVAPAAA